MREEIFAISTQNSYAENRSNFMPDGTTGPEISSGNQSPQERPIQQETNELIPVAKTEEEEKEAAEGIKQFVIENEKQRQEALKKAQKEVREKHPGQEIKKKGWYGERKHPYQEKYFPTEVPEDPILKDRIFNFCVEAQGRDLQELGTTILVKHYLLIKAQANAAQKDSKFLSRIENQLLNRNIYVEKLMLRATQERYSQFRMPGAADGDGEERQERRWDVTIRPDITNPQIRLEMEIANAQNNAHGEFDLDVLDKAHDALLRLNGTVPQDQKQWAIDDIVEVIQTVRSQHRRYQEEERKKGWYGERKLTLNDKDGVRKEVDRMAVDRKEGRQTGESLDQLFNRIFDKAEANVREEFKEAMGNAGNKEYTDFLYLLNDLREEAAIAKDADKMDLLTKLIQQFSQEYKLREILHNAYYIAETSGEAKDFAGWTKQFASEFTDLSFLTPEVEIAYRIREQVLYQIKRENNGTIPYEKVAFMPGSGESEWEKRTRTLLTRANEQKLISATPLEPWKINRALSISRGIGMVLLRFPEIVAECPLRAAPKMNEGQPSIPWETISWELNPLDHKIKRYEIGRETAAFLYAAVKRKKSGLWNQDELRDAMGINALNALATFDDEERMVDLRNLTKIGGFATHSSWRAFVAALEEDQSRLRPLLSRNPGLAMKLLFNQYEIAGLNRAKKEWIQKYKIDHPDFNENSREFLNAWAIKEKELRAAQDPDKQWKEEDINTWKDASRRIPHVILRIITDEANKLLSAGQRRALLKDIFGNLDGDALKKAYSETEEDLTLAKENLMRRRREKGNNFTGKEDELIDEDFAVIGDEARILRAKRLQAVLQKELNTNETLHKKINESIENRFFPFTITTEDVPFNEFKFAQTGGRGLVTRRNNDWYQEVQANDTMIDLVKHINRYQSPEQIVEQLAKLYDFAEVHDRSRSYETIEHLARGIIRFYELDGIYKIPVIGEALGIVNLIKHGGKRGQSFAQTVYGANAMAWDSDDIYNFTEQLRKAILTGKEGMDIVTRLRKETGGTLPQALGKKTKVGLYLLIMFLLYEMTKVTISEK